MQENKNLETPSQKSSNTIVGVAAVLMMLAIVTLPSMALAASADGDMLANVYDTLVTWTEGAVGKVITLGFMIVGTVAGVIRQSIMAFAVGIAAGLGIYNADSIISVIFGAVL